LQEKGKEGGRFHGMAEAAMKPFKNFEQIIRPQSMIEEVKRIVQLMFPDFDFSWVNWFQIYNLRKFHSTHPK